MSSVSVDGDYDSGVDQKLSCKCQAGVCSSPQAGGLGLITATTCDPIHKTPNILESTTIKSSSPSATPPSSPPPPSSMASIFKKDLRGIGFLDDIGGGIDGLMSCTESLGFESSDERRLRLHFVADEEYEVDEDEDEHEHEREQEEYLEEEKEGKKEEEVEEDNEEESVEERGFHGEGLRTRCHELVAHHRHNHHHSNVWSQQCVPTR
ncbi:hypothetical protein OIU76_016763 [Salix suchowensis]|nr:hypothetical protein OIU76_016763 [Salix suchowensis]